MARAALALPDAAGYAAHFYHAIGLACDGMARRGTLAGDRTDAMEANDSHSYDSDLPLGPAAGDMDTARQLQECALAGYEQAASMLPDSWEVQYHLALHFFSIRKVAIPALLHGVPGGSMS